MNTRVDYKGLGAITEQIQRDFPDSLYVSIILPGGTAYEAYDSKKLAEIIPMLAANLQALESHLIEQIAANN